MFLFLYSFVFLKELSVVTGQTIINGDRECADIYTVNWHGLYIGNRNTTVTGKPCKKWRDAKHPSFGVGNYCRSPSADPDTKGPWCYINESPWWEYCFVPRCNIDCRPSTIDKGYSGTLNITHSGLTCHTWSDRSLLPSGGNVPIYNDELMNFCRTPVKDAESTPWCFTTSPIKRWEHCDVPLCGTLTTTVCPDLKGEPRMIHPKRLTGYRYGDVVTFNCEAGYTLNTNNTLKCLAQSHRSILGKWNSSQPKCIASILCNPIHVEESIVINEHTTAMHFNEPVTLSCKKGFSGTSIQMSCNHDGTWPDQRPTCSPVNCMFLNLDPHVKSSNTMPKFNDVVTLSCEEGYFAASIIVKCYANGSWPSNRPNCTPVYCMILNLDPHVKSSNTMPKFNDVVTLSCEEGYFAASISVKCYANGSWPSNRPNCTPVNCTRLNLDPHVKSSNTMPKFNDVVTLSCEEGYFAASISVKCYANGSWPSDRPNCTPITCSMLIADEQGIKSENFTKYNENVTLSCKEGYIGVVTILKCNAYGFWPPNRPNCTEKSQSYKDPMEKRCTCMSYGLFGGILAAFIAISVGGHIATCFYFRKREGKPGTVYEDMQFKTVDRQNGSNEETYTELT